MVKKKLKFYIKNSSGKVIQWLKDINKEYPDNHVVIAHYSKKEAMEAFKQMEEKFPKGEGLLEVLMDIPFENS